MVGILNSAFCTKKLHSLILTELDDGSHLEFCYLDFGHLSFFSQTHSHVAKLVPTICSKKIYSFILNKLDDGSHLKFCHLEFCFLGFSHLSFFSQTHSHLPRLFPTICTKKLHSFILTQFDGWQPSWILPFCTKLWLKLIQFQSKLIHSHSSWWWQPSWILPSWIWPFWIQPFRISLKLTHTCQDWFSWFAQKKLHSLILTHFHDGSHLEFCHVGFNHCHLGFRHLVIFSLDSLKNTLTPLWHWLRLIPSDSSLFILTQLEDGSHLEFCHPGFNHLSFSSETHSHLHRLVPTISTTKNLHSHFPPHHWHKKSSLIDSDSTWWWQPSRILQCWIQTPWFLLSDSLKKHFHSILTLTQTNSIWLKLIHYHSTWWWQPSWILSSWILPSWIQPS